MATTRADVNTSTRKKRELYSDFLTSFAAHPLTRQLARVTNEEAVTQSIRNLMLTDRGEKFFHPEIGSSIRKSLFEPFGPFAAENITRAISETIHTCEPRATILGLNVYAAPDVYAYAVNLTFAVGTNPQPIQLSVILKPVRN